MVNGLAKMFSSVLFSNSSFSCAINFLSLIWQYASNFFAQAFNFLYQLFWLIIRFVLGALEALEYIINSFLGINSTVDDYYTFAKNADFLDTLVKTFRAVLGVAIVLLIIFSIYAIIKQEFQYALSGFGAEGKVKDNNKSQIIKNIFVKLMTMLLLPISMVFILMGVSSILTSFNRAFKGDDGEATIASTLLASSMYDSNRYRTYAQKNKRLPIVIEAYDATNYAPDESVLLANEIRSYEVQDNLEKTALSLGAGNGLSFAKSLNYQNNKLVNSSAYADFYESFVCTAEQYHVMADFIDYCEKNSKPYYIKSIDDKNIEWKYVDSAVFDKNNYALTINYRDASDIDGDGETSDSYSIVYSTSYNVTSPISDTLDSIMAMLGIGEKYSLSFNEMERDEDSINIVQWSNEKVLIQFSKDFKLNHKSTWTPADEIILYEYYHYASNNVLSDYTLQDLMPSGSGAELEAKQIVYRDQIAGGAYAPEQVIDCVLINGTYYLTEKSQVKTDLDGNFYYQLKSGHANDENFLTSTEVDISKNPTDCTLKLSDDFDINKRDTWNYSDQIIVYEYYKDLSYRNSLSKYKFSEFYSTGFGVSLPTYTITVSGSTTTPNSSSNYVLINGTYYKLSGGNLPNSDTEDFLTEVSSNAQIYYSFEVNFGTNFDSETVGIPSTGKISDLIYSESNVSDFAILGTSEDDGEVTYVYDYKLSNNFDYRNVETWTYRDYFLFYLYITHPTAFYGLNDLKFSGINGELGKGTVNGHEVDLLRIKDNSGYFYLDIDGINLISEFNILENLNVIDTLNNNNINTSEKNLFINQSNNTYLVSSQTEFVQLEFSDGFSEYDISTWNVRDMILTVLAYAGYISTNGVEGLPNGYSSLVYNIMKTEGEGENEKQVYDYSLYKFGKKYDEHDPSRTIYLNTKFVTEELGYNSVDEWFNVSAISFIAKVYGFETSDLIASRESIMNKLYEGLSEYVYDVNSLIEMLIKENITKFGETATNISNIYSNVVSYTYRNDTFNFSDLSSWTNLDLALYCLTGTASGVRIGNVISVDTNKYFVISPSQALRISGTGNPFESTISENNTISSQPATGFEGTTFNELESYYDTYLQSLVHDLSELQNMSNANNFKLISNAKYYYKSENAISQTNTTLNVSNLTNFDIILAVLLKDDGGLTTTEMPFDAYTNDSSYFVKVGEKFVEASNGVIGNVSLTTTGSLNLLDSTKKFSAGAESYISFKEEKTKLDAVIFNLTNSMTPKEYIIYTYNDASFIVVENSLVEFKSDYAQPDIPSISNQKIEQLYSEYYSKYYSNALSETVSVNIIENVTYDVGVFNINDVSTWTPFKFVLYNNHIISDSVETTDFVSITGSLLTSLDGKNTYFYFENILNAERTEHYISVKDLLSVQTQEGETNLVENEEQKHEILLRYGLIETEEVDTQTIVLSTNENLNKNFLTFKQKVTTSIGLNDKVTSNLTSSVLTSEFNLSDTATWTWFDLVYYYFVGEARQDNNFVVYTDSSNNKYISIISQTSGISYIKIDSQILQLFSQVSQNVVFADSEFAPLSIILEKLTNAETTAAVYNTTTTNGITFKVFAGANGSNYAVYGVLPTNISNTSDDDNLYIYQAQNPNNFLNYSIFEFILAYASGSDNANNFESNVYKFGDYEYFEVVESGVFLNKTNLALNNWGISYRDDGDGKKQIVSEKNFGELLGFSTDGSDNRFRTFSSVADMPEAIKNHNSSEGVDDYGTSILIKLSDGFDASDYSTWKVSDLVLYYLFSEGLFKDSSGNELKNFQWIVENGIELSLCNLVVDDEYGNAQSKLVLKINGYDDIYLDHSVFGELYTRIMQNYSSSSSGVSLTSTVGESSTVTSQTCTNFEFSYTVDVDAYDFIYNNYYFFTIPNGDKLTELRLKNPENLTLVQDGSINLKLSEGFDINNISNWTLLDAIVIEEYSREDLTVNFFDGMSFEDLKNKDNFYVIYKSNENDLILSINGNYYKLTDYLSKTDSDSDVYTFDDTQKVSSRDDIKNGEVNEYSFRILESSTRLRANNKFEVNNVNTNVFNINYDKTLLTYNNLINYDSAEIDDSKTIYRWVNTLDLELFAFNLLAYDNAIVSNVVKKVNWPQKLMNDMKVIYPDLNWEVLVATDGWLDTLGDYSSAMGSGEYISDGNSSNITAAGMVLSEFFLSIAKESGKGYAEYEYESVFDEEVLKALMLSTMGEDEYETVSMQAKIFVDMFNTSFAQILDDIADERGLNIVDGKIDNFTMSVYKSYLATALLSSDLGAYFYKIATRVYSQYTIYEYLANSSGDYEHYYLYINGLNDDQGNIVDAFKYGSFLELTKYENFVMGRKTPIFTYNFEKVFKHFYPDIAYNEGYFTTHFDDITEKLDNYYSNIYSSGGRIEDTSDLYCFMFDAYWTMNYLYYSQGGSKSSFPDYLKTFHDYCVGKIARWSIIDDISADGGIKYLDKKGSFEFQRGILKPLIIVSGLKIFMPDVALDIDTNDPEAEEEYKNFFDRIDLDIFSAKKLVTETMEKSPVYLDLARKALDVDFYRSIFTVLGSSEKGNENSWNKICSINETLKQIIDKLSEVATLGAGEGVDGCFKLTKYNDNSYQSAIKTLSNFQNYLDSYISVQKNLDKITKTGVTYALSQFGQNYVSTGFNFTIENRNYTLSAAVSSSRLAEYVYGGNFLTQFGIAPTFTSENFMGIVHESRAYDSTTNQIVGKIVSWDRLRQFASKIADYTAKLYYMTNFNDLSDNISDSILMTDKINIRLGSSGYQEVTMEYAILYYMLTNENITISADTFVRLMFGDNSRTLGNLNCTISDINNLANSLEDSSVSLSDTKKKETLVEYLAYVFADSYNSFGYYYNESKAQRIHSIFVNVISYLLINEEDKEDGNEQAINFDNWSMKDFRTTIMAFIVDYVQNPSETSKENIARYLSLYYLMNSQFLFTYHEGDLPSGTAHTIGRTISAVYVNKENVEGSKDNTAFYYIDALTSDPNMKRKIFADFSIDQESSNKVIELAGVANRPIEELVNLEYDHLYNKYGNYDEANGDTFVVCFYDNVSGKFIPFMGTNSLNYQIGSNFDNYMKDYGYRIHTDYYDVEAGDTFAYPIVAKGIIMADGKPTAIKIEDYEVKFYRTNITSILSIDDDALEFTKVTNEVNTIGFSNFVNTSTFSKGGSNKNAMFIGSKDSTYFANSNTSALYIQYQLSYTIPSSDDMGGIMVLDTFDSFFSLSMLAVFMLSMSLVVIMPILYKGTATVMRRVLDMITLVLAGPLVISTSQLNGKGFGTWLQYMTQTTLAVFGYIVGFNIYYILISTVSGMTFVSDATLLKIHSIGGLSFLSSSLVNTLLRFIYILIAGGVIKTAGNTIVSVVTAGKVDSAFEPSMAGKTGDVMGQAKKVVEDIKKTAKSIDKIVTGEAAMDAIAAAKEMMPGVQLVKAGKEAVHRSVDKIKAKALEVGLQAAGVPKAAAQEAAKAYEKVAKEQRQNKREANQARANRFLGKHNLGKVEDSASIILDESKTSKDNRKKVQDKIDAKYKKRVNKSEKKAKKQIKKGK